MSSLTGEPLANKTRSLEKRWGLTTIIDQVFYFLTLFLALGVGFVLTWVAYEIVSLAVPAIQGYGFNFLTSTTWDPVRNIYGVLPQVYGTLVTSFIALLIAVPVGVGIAIFLSEDFVPSSIRTPIAFAIELLAAVPSVVYGLWGIYVLIPFLRPLYLFLHNNFGWIPLFSTQPRGNSMLTLGIVLSIMIIPTIIAISRSTLISLPRDLRQGALALGATRWEAILRVLVPAGFSGIIGSIMLALGRALGETMAAAMLVGNANRITPSLLAPGATIASLIASQFGEAGREQVAALMYSGVVLMAMSLLVNISAEMIIRRFQNVE